LVKLLYTLTAIHEKFIVAKSFFLEQNFYIVSRRIVWPHYERRYHLSIYFEGSARSC